MMEGDIANAICGVTFSTLKAAREAGFREPSAAEYGGERIELKGHILLRGAKRAKSKSEWEREGYCVKDGMTPHGQLHARAHGRSMHYSVYRDDQVEPKKPISSEKRGARQAAARKAAATRAQRIIASEREDRIANRKHEERCERIGIAPKGRAASWLEDGEIDEDEAELIGFKTRYRHQFTDYDQHFENAALYGPNENFDVFGSQEDIRQEARERMTESPIPSGWREYLQKYGFQSEIAAVLATVLADPTRCHPTWFKEAEIAVRRTGTPTADITYDAISEAIAKWRQLRGQRRLTRSIP